MFLGLGLVKRSEFGVFGLMLGKDGHAFKMCTMDVSGILQNLHWFDGG